MASEIMTGALMALCLVIGALFGALCARHRRPHDAPAPVDLSYDADNPINGGSRRGEVVRICGADWIRM